MAQNDPYTAAVFSLPITAENNFDGSESSTGAAIVSGIAGSGDAQIRLESYDSSLGGYQKTAQLSDADGNTTFSGDWHTQFNRIMINGGGSPSDGDQQIVVTNVSGANINVGVDGDER